MSPPPYTTRGCTATAPCGGEVRTAKDSGFFENFRPTLAFPGPVITGLLLPGTNLTDAEGRNHVSFLKDFAPLPGRNVRFAIRVRF